MPGRYDRSKQLESLDFSSRGAFGSEPEKKRKPSALEDFLRFGSAVAPAVGTGLGMGIGALAGGIPSAGIGAVPGAGLGGAIGGAAGAGLGALAGAGADKMAEPDVQAEEARMRREYERQARQQAALQMLGGF